MEQIKSIEHILDNMDKNIVYKAKKSPLRIFLLFIAGIAFFVVNSVFEWKTNSIFPPLLIVLGSSSVLTGIFQLAFRKGHYVFAENNQRLKSSEICFQVNERDKLVRLIESGNLNGIKELKTSVSDGLKLRLMATRDGKMGLSQVIAYSSNEYLNITTVQSHSFADTCFMMELFQKNK